MPQHVGQLDFGMAIPVIVSHDVAADRVFRAPTVTGVTVFAAMQPDRLAVNHFNVVYRADSGASSAASAVLVGSEAGVRQGYEFAK